MVTYDQFLREFVADYTKYFLDTLKTCFYYCASMYVNVGCENCSVKNTCDKLCKDKKLAQWFLRIENEARANSKKLKKEVKA